MNKITRKIFFIFIIFLINSFLFFSEETKLIGNYIKLVVNNDDGRFNLYGRNSINDEWIPLLFEDNPATTFFRFFASQFQIPFGEEGIGRNSSIDIINNKIVYTWSNNAIKYEIEYELVSSDDSNYANTLLVDLKINNQKENTFNFDYLFCIDTYLGELSKKHFILSNDEVISNEYDVQKPSTITSILSYSSEKNIGINILFGNKYQVAPDRMFFANWKRVERNIGLFKAFDGRSFDLKPYSINDSSVVLEYLNQNIEPGKSVIYRFIISLKNNISLNDKDKPDEKEGVKKISEKEDYKGFDNVSPNENKPDNDVSDLLEYLDKIDSRLKTKDPYLKEEVDIYNKSLEELKKKRTK